MTCVTPKSLLWIAVLAAGLTGAMAVGVEERRGEIGSCEAYAGLPAGERGTAGMAFIPGGDFRMGSEIGRAHV